MKASWSRCPHCKKLLDFRVEGGGGTAGPDFGQPAVYLCKWCNSPIGNGLKEWKDISFYQKSVAILRTIYTVVLYGVPSGMLAGGIILYVFQVDEQGWKTFIPISISFALLIFGVVYIRALTQEIK